VRQGESALLEAEAASDVLEKISHYTAAGGAFSSAGRVREAYKAMYASLQLAEKGSGLEAKQHFLLGRLTRDFSPSLSLRHYRAGHARLSIEPLTALVQSGDRGSAKAAAATLSRTLLQENSDSYSPYSPGALYEHAGALAASPEVTSEETIAFYLFTAVLSEASLLPSDASRAWEGLRATADHFGKTGWALEALLGRARLHAEVDSFSHQERETVILAAFIAALRVQDPVWCRRLMDVSHLSRDLTLSPRCTAIAEAVEAIGLGRAHGARALQDRLRLGHPMDREVLGVVCPAVEALLLRCDLGSVLRY